MQPTTRRGILPYLAGLGAIAGAAVLAGPKKAAAQARITLQSLQDQITAILNGNSPAGTLTYASSSDPRQVLSAGGFVNIPNRSVTFTKQTGGSALRIDYSEQIQYNAPFLIQVLLDGNPADLRVLQFPNANGNYFPFNMTVLLPNVGAGQHQIALQVLSNGACVFTPFPPSMWILGVEELP